jgi:hypothetical protein
MKRTFIDSGVLIYAARGQGEIAAVALGILTDFNREFASSVFVKLEVLPKAIYNRQADEVEFYEQFFKAVAHWATDIDEIIRIAEKEANSSGLGPMDALHIAAAMSVGATEFVTTEKPEKSIHRTKSIKVTSIHPNQ